MIFRKIHIDGISSFECIINNDESIFKMFHRIPSAFWGNQQINILNMIFKHADIIIDVNKILLNQINDQNSIIDCFINEDPNSSIILQIYRNFKNRDFKQVQVRKNIGSNELQEYLSHLFNVEVIGIFKVDDVGLLSKIEHLDDEYVVIVEREWCKFIIHSILEEGESNTIECLNCSNVSELKQLIADIYQYDIESFSLFNDKHWLSENNPIYMYQIGNNSIIRYCHFEDINAVEQIGNSEKDGTFSTVYPARIIATGEIITIKRYNRSGQSQSMESYKYMIRELVTLTRIRDNQRLVQLKNYYRDQKAFYIGIEHMAGGSIEAYIAENWPLDENLIRTWSKQILEGLMILHGERVIHRNLRPSIILLDENNNIKISGFSLSKYLMGAMSTALSQGFVQSKSGKFNYMAPEVFDEEDSGWKVDIWAFGAILVEMVTGKPPYHGMNVIQFYDKICRTGTIVYNEPSHGMSSDLKNFISRCLKRDPHERPRAAELLQDRFLILSVPEMEIG